MKIHRFRAVGQYTMKASFLKNSVHLQVLMRDCDEGKLRLPDFQRRLVRDQGRIINPLAFIYEGLPVGALMTLDPPGDVTFAARSVEGAPGVTTGASA